MSESVSGAKILLEASQALCQWLMAAGSPPQTIHVPLRPSPCMFSESQRGQQSSWPGGMCGKTRMSNKTAGGFGWFRIPSNKPVPVYLFQVAFQTPVYLRDRFIRGTGLFLLLPIKHFQLYNQGNPAAHHPKTCSKMFQCLLCLLPIFTIQYHSFQFFTHFENH